VTKLNQQLMTNVLGKVIRRVGVCGTGLS